MSALRRRVFRTFVRALARNVDRAPGLVFRIADLMAPIVFPRQHDRKTWMRNFIVADHLRIAGYGRLRNSIAPPDPRVKNLSHPMILGTFHLGAISAIGTILQDLPADVLVLRATPKYTTPAPNVTVAVTRGTEQDRARVFHTAIQYLRAGNFIFVPLDPEESSRIDAPFRGRTLQLARGPFALARITRTPILPLVARWNGTRMELEIGEMIAASDDEAQLAAAAAKWLERYLERYPDEESSRVRELTV
jgi:hypothetical protein